jgi:hypothetical protein
MPKDNKFGGKTRIGNESRIARYIENAAKEYAEWNERGRTDDEGGQFWGAILQGRRYNQKGKQKK